MPNTLVVVLEATARHDLCVVLLNTQFIIFNTKLIMFNAKFIILNANHIAKVRRELAAVKDLLNHRADVRNCKQTNIFQGEILHCLCIFDRKFNNKKWPFIKMCNTQQRRWGESTPAPVLSLQVKL